jgi:hypothetical protein
MGSGNSDLTFFRGGPIFLSPWDTTDFAGHQITSVTANITTGYLAPNGIDNATSSIVISSGDFSMNLGHIGTTGTVTILGAPSNGPWPAIGPFDTAPIFRVDVVLNSPPITVRVPIDATTIQSYANPTQLAEQLNPLPVVWTGLFAAYSGWTITGYTVTAPGSYGSAGPAILVPSVLNFVIGHDNGYVIDAYESQLSNLTTTPPTNFSMFAPRLLVTTSFFGLLFDLHPASSPAIPSHNGPLIMTQEYEIRSRNQAAFRFVTRWPTLPDTVVRFIARCYASQGKLWNSGTGNYDEYWTSVPMCSSDESLPSAWGETITIDAGSHIDGLPANYGGTIVTIPANVASPGGNATFAGPWNKLRFALYPATPPTDFTGWTLQIVANAREM